MKKAQEQVREFMRAAGQETPDRPGIPAWQTSDLRIKLIVEETRELTYALGRKDLTLTADAIADLLYVVIGTAVACGIEIEPIWEEVHRSNMSKFIDGHKDANGKWIKGPSYSPANLGPIIEAQQKGAK